jgi:hypothetical protein
VLVAECSTQNLARFRRYFIANSPERELIGATIGRSRFRQGPDPFIGAPEPRSESARCAGSDVVAEVAAGALPSGWKNPPKQQSPGPESGVTIRAETCKRPPARHLRGLIFSLPSFVQKGDYEHS